MLICHAGLLFFFLRRLFSLLLRSAITISYADVAAIRHVDIGVMPPLIFMMLLHAAMLPLPPPCYYAMRCHA